MHRLFGYLRESKLRSKKFNFSSIVDLSPLISDHLFDFAPMAVVRKALLLTESSRFNSRVVRKSWNSSLDELGYL